MRRLVHLAVAALWWAAVSAAAFASPERVEELWRSPAGLSLMSQAVNAEDGSVWARSDAVVIRFSSEGAELERRDLPELGYWVDRLTISPYDGTWWLSNTLRLTHLSTDGTVLADILTAMWEPLVDPADGSIWGTYSYFGESCDDPEWLCKWHGRVRHLGADGASLWVRDYAGRVAGLGLYADGSAWIVVDYPDGARLECLSATGEPLGASVPVQLVSGPACAMERSPIDGSFYAFAERSTLGEEGYDGWVGRMAADGSLLWKREGLCDPLGIALNPVDGSVWVADQREIVDDAPTSVITHLSANGTELWRSSAFSYPWRLALDPRDGSVWVSDLQNEQIIHLRVVPRPFPDVAEDSWARGAIAACAASSIVEGFPGGSYRPDLEVTRGQMAVYIARALALPTGDAAVHVPSDVAEPTFPDVDTEHWAYKYVEYCYAQGVVEGFPGGNYQPDVLVNRGQMAVYIARSQVTPSGDAALPDPPAAPTFPDVTADNDWSWCYPHVEYCAASNIVQGYADGYHPERIVTRDQMAVYIARAFALSL